MFSSRRLAKRSIIGTRVCCLWQDGRFYPAVIQSMDSDIFGHDHFIVGFEDGATKSVTEKEIIGPGFQNITVAKLKNGQKVFVTHNGREVKGIIVDHDNVQDDVIINVILPNGEEHELVRRLEEVRLLQSRKSARLLDQDTDYSRLADFHGEAKKRTVSQIIEVPHPKVRRRIKEDHYTDDSEEPMVTEDNEMDEHMAAMVLTSLSTSPASPNFPKAFTLQGSPNGTAVSGYSSSGASSMSKSDQLDSPSPPSQINVPTLPMFSNLDDDEGIELDATHAYFSDDLPVKRKRPSTRTAFKCTWPNCSKMFNTNARVESHVRVIHLGPRDDSDSELSDHEEEFYYTEVEVSVDTVTETFADMNTCSSPVNEDQDVSMDATRSIQDHDYQKKEPHTLPLSIPGKTTEVKGQGLSYPQASNHQPYTFSGSWQANHSEVQPIRISKVSPSRFSFGTSPKNSPMHKKSRSDVKKCRKVYGMENRDLWCTQCKWKKACSRFIE